MSAEDNPSAPPADIGEALVAALGFEPAEGRKLGRKSAGSAIDDVVVADESREADPSLDGAFAIVSPDQAPNQTVSNQHVAAQTDGAVGAAGSAGTNGSNGSAPTPSEQVAGGQTDSASSSGANNRGPATGKAGTATGNRNRSGGSRKSKKRRTRNNNSRNANSGQPTTAQSGGQPSGTSGSDGTSRPGAHSAAPAIDDIKSAARPSVSTTDAKPGGAHSADAKSDGGKPDGAPSDGAPPQAGPAATAPSSGAETGQSTSGGGATAGSSGSAAQPTGTDPDPGRSNGSGEASGRTPIEELAAVTGDLKDLIDLPAVEPPPPSAADAIAAAPAAAPTSSPAAASPAATTSPAATSPAGATPAATSPAATSPATTAAATGAAAKAAGAAAAVPTSPPTMPATGAPAEPAAAPANPAVQAESTKDATARIETRADATPDQSATRQELEIRGDQRLQPVPAVKEQLSKPGSGFEVASLQNVFKRKRRVQARKVRRVIRHIDPWSVLTFSVLFHLCVFAALLLASVLVWNAAEAAGTIENMETFILELGDYETFEIKGEVVFRAAVAIAGILTLASSVLLVLLTVVFNLISDLVGGIRLTVIEEETVRVRRKKQAS